MDQVKSIDPARDKPELTIIEQKTKKSRTLVFNPAAMEVIDRRLDNHAGDVWLFQSPLPVKRGCKPVAISSRAVSKAFSKAGDQIKPKVNISTHSMRKTRGYAMHKAGVSIEQIAEVLNHADTRVTRRYIGLTAESAAQTYLNVQL